MLKPDDNAGEIMERHEEKIEAIEKIFRGILGGIVLYLIILPKVSKLKKKLEALKELNKFF